MEGVRQRPIILTSVTEYSLANRAIDQSTHATSSTHTFHFTYLLTMLSTPMTAYPPTFRSEPYHQQISLYPSETDMAAIPQLSGRRIQIVGVIGAGKVRRTRYPNTQHQHTGYTKLTPHHEKSTFANQLSSILSIPVYDLDHLFRGTLSEEEAKRTVKKIVEENEEWVIDGKYVSPFPRFRGRIRMLRLVMKKVIVFS